MGGTGGFFTGRPDPEALRRQIREAETAATGEEFNAKVNGLLAEALAEFNDRDVAGTQELLDEVRQVIADRADTDIETRFGGSVAKHTYVDGLSDVDALVVFDPASAPDTSPAALRSLLAGLLRQHLSSAAVEEGSLAVTVTRGPMRLQLLPALRDGQALKIANSDGAGWSSIRPQAFASALTDANRRMDGKLVPTIKLAKSIISVLPEQQRLSGYHVEALAVEVFRAYDGSRTPKAMLRYFFENAPSRVLAPIADPTGQSWHVDEALGLPNSLPRRVVSDALGRVGRKIQNADGAASVEMWNRIVEGD